MKKKYLSQTQQKQPLKMQLIGKSLKITHIGHHGTIITIGHHHGSKNIMNEERYLAFSVICSSIGDSWLIQRFYEPKK